MGLFRWLSYLSAKLLLWASSKVTICGYNRPPGKMVIEAEFETITSQGICISTLSAAEAAASAAFGPAKNTAIWSPPLIGLSLTAYGSPSMFVKQTHRSVSQLVKGKCDRPLCRNSVLFVKKHRLVMAPRWLYTQRQIWICWEKSEESCPAGLLEEHGDFSQFSYSYIAQTVLPLSTCYHWRSPQAVFVLPLSNILHFYLFPKSQLVICPPQGNILQWANTSLWGNLKYKSWHCKGAGTHFLT